MGYSYKFVSEVNGVQYLLIFLPLLTFKWIFFSNITSIKNYLGQVLVLAVPGFIITLFLQAGTLIYINGYATVFGWKRALTVCAVIAATDSGPALNALQNANASLQLQTLMEGESLVNNMVSGMFFFTFLDMLQAENYSVEDFVIKFLIVSFGAIGVGLVTAMVFTPLIRALRNPYLIATFTFFVQFLSFFFAEMPMVGFAVPGLLALIVSGFYMAIYLKPFLQPKCLSTLLSIWDFAGFVTGSLAFVITGTFLGVYLGDNVFLAEEGVFDSTLHTNWTDFQMAFVFLLFVLLFRFAVVLILWPILLCAGPKISWKESVIMSFCAFRGIVGVSIILFLAWSDNFDKKFTHVSYLFMTVLIFFSQIFQAFLMKPLSVAVSYNRFKAVESDIFAEIKRKLQKDAFCNMKELEANAEIAYNVDWAIICDIFEFKKGDFEEKYPKMRRAKLLFDYKNKNESILNLLEDHEYFDSKTEEQTEYDLSKIYREAEFTDTAPISTLLKDKEADLGPMEKSNAVDDQSNYLTNYKENPVNFSQTSKIRMSNRSSITLERKINQKFKNKSASYKTTIREVAIRNRIYKSVRNLVQTEFVEGFCSYKTRDYINLIVDLCSCHLKKDLFCFDLYSRLFHSGFKADMYFRVFWTPIFGQFFRKRVLDYFLQRYEMQMVILDVLKAILEFNSYPVRTMSGWNTVEIELRREILKFEDLNDQFSQKYWRINRTIRTTYAARILLFKSRISVQKLLDFGEIGKRECADLHGSLNQTEQKFKLIIQNSQKPFNLASSRERTRMVSHNHQNMRSYFRIFKEIDAGASQSFFKKLVIEDRNDVGVSFITDIKMAQFGIQNNDLSVYFVYSGILELKNINNVLVKKATSKNVFGLVQLVSSDVKIQVRIKKKSQIYKTSLEDVKDLMSEYPNLEKRFFSIAVLNYFRFCTRGIAKSKTKYFRTLKKLPIKILKKFIKQGLIESFETREEFMNYVLQNKLLSVGFFVLSGMCRIKHKNFRASRYKESSNYQKFDSVKSTQRERASHNYETNGIDLIRDKNNMVEEIKSSITRRSYRDEPNLTPIEIFSGNAIEVFPFHIESFEIDSEYEKFQIMILEKKDLLLVQSLKKK